MWRSGQRSKTILTDLWGPCVLVGQLSSSSSPMHPLSCHADVKSPSCPFLLHASDLISPSWSSLATSGCVCNAVDVPTTRGDQAPGSTQVVEALSGMILCAANRCRGKTWEGPLVQRYQNPAESSRKEFSLCLTRLLDLLKHGKTWRMFGTGSRCACKAVRARRRQMWRWKMEEVALPFSDLTEVRRSTCYVVCSGQLMNS